MRALECAARFAIFASALVLAGGCGSGDGSESSQAPAKPATGRAPTELLGTYTTTLKRSDLPPNAPQELTAGSLKWRLTIANSGGIDNGPSFAIADATQGDALENPSFGVSGDRVILHREECAAGGKDRFYENEYRFDRSGKSLTFTKIKNSCPDKVALTVLTSEPWTKTK